MYTTLLKEADPDGFGAVSGDVAVKFFERTKLPPEILGQVCCSGVPDETGTLFQETVWLTIYRYGKSRIPRIEASSHQLVLVSS